MSWISKIVQWSKTRSGIRQNSEDDRVLCSPESSNVVVTGDNPIRRLEDDSEMGYEDFSMLSDGDALLAVIRNGLRYEELLQQGVIPYDDWLRAKWKDA